MLSILPNENVPCSFCFCVIFYVGSGVVGIDSSCIKISVTHLWKCSTGTPASYRSSCSTEEELVIWNGRRRWQTKPNLDTSSNEQQRPAMWSRLLRCQHCLEVLRCESQRITRVLCLCPKLVRTWSGKFWQICWIGTMSGQFSCFSSRPKHFASNIQRCRWDRPSVRMALGHVGTWWGNWRMQVESHFQFKKQSLESPLVSLGQFMIGPVCPQPQDSPIASFLDWLQTASSKDLFFA